MLIWPEDGVLRREEVRRLLDGSLYQEKVVRTKFAEEQKPLMEDEKRGTDDAKE